MQFGGQTAIKLAKHMDEHRPAHLTAPRPMPLMKPRTANALMSCWNAAAFPARRAAPSLPWTKPCRLPRRSGYPVLMRPSYVLGGQNMIVAYNSSDVIEYMGVIAEACGHEPPGADG